MSNLFPVAFNNQLALAKSKLIAISSDYSKPDSLVYLDKVPVQFRERSGFVFFFKYKNKRDDNTWKIASVGIIPADAKKFEFDESPKQKFWQRRQYEFTELSNAAIDNETPLQDQLKKALKKMLYSKRNSAAQFYKDENKMKGDYYPAFNVGE